MDRSQVAVIIPAYNEAETIGDVVRSALPYGEVYIIDDASSDDTKQVALQAGAKVFTNPTNMGYDKTIDRGFALANSDGRRYFITMDADGQHDPAMLRQFTDAFEKSMDLVIGVRPQKQRLAETIFSWYTRLRFGVTDPLCGMKGYTQKLYAMLGHFDSYHSIGTELAIFGLKNKAPWTQFPVPMRQRPDGTPRFGSSLKANWKIFRALLRSL